MVLGRKLEGDAAKYSHDRRYYSGLPFANLVSAREPTHLNCISIDCCLGNFTEKGDLLEFQFFSSNFCSCFLICSSILPSITCVVPSRRKTNRASLNLSWLKLEGRNAMRYYGQ